MGSLLSSTSQSQSAQDVMKSFDQSNTNDYQYPSSLTEQTHRVVEEHSPKFDINDPQMVEFLKENGYVVIKDVATKEEIATAFRLLWEFLEEKCDMKENDPTTWTLENFSKLGDSRTGIASFSRIQHSKFLWYLRLLPNVIKIFENIYQTDDLLTSFDGGNVFRPWHNPDLANEHPKTSTGWFHVDQGKSLLGFHCVQGLVSLTDCNQFTGGFCVIPGTHHHHSEYISSVAKSNHNFVMIPSQSPFLAPPYRQILPVCSAGDVILWDSRTIHCNCPSLVTSLPHEISTQHLLRVVGYVCMTPTEYIDRTLPLINDFDMKTREELLETRVRLYEREVGSSHWPHLLSSFISKSTSVPRARDLWREERARIGMVVGKDMAQQREREERDREREEKEIHSNQTVS